MAGAKRSVRWPARAPTATVVIGAFGSSAGSFTVGDSSNTTFAGVISGDPLVAGTTVFTKQGAGTLTLSGANTYTGATVINNGTLALDNNNTATPRLAGTTKITVNSGGTLLLAQSGGTSSNDRINDSATITLNGGKFSTGGLSEYSGSLGPLPGKGKGPTPTNGPVPKPIVTNVTAGIGALTLQASSVIDLGSGKSILAFANSSSATWTSGQVLSIWNWTGNLAGGGADQIYFGTDTSGLSSGQLAQIEFFSGAGTGSYGLGVAALLANGELVPIPEPGTWIGGALALAAVGFSQRRRFKRAGIRASDC